MPSSNPMDSLVRIEPAIAPLAPSQDTTPDQLSSFYRPVSIPLTRHSPLPVASDAPTNALSNAAAKTIVKEVIEGGGAGSIGVASLNALTGALSLTSPGGTIAIGTAGATVTEDVVSATSSQLGAIELNTDLGGTATAPNVVATHLASPLPVLQGGTGLTAPALVAGNGIAITGSWPDQTVAVNTPLAVAYGGSGSSGPSLVAGSGIVITGSWPSQTIAASASGGISIVLFTNRNLSGTVSVSANTLTLIDSITMTMPSSGGPWRALVNYDYYKFGGVKYHSYIYDGTHAWGGADFVTQDNLTSLQNGGMSPVTYANSAGVTFYVYIYDTGASTIETGSQVYGSSPAVSYMQVAVWSSN